jgi:polyphosphate kinase 2 (PPK2 family)
LAIGDIGERAHWSAYQRAYEDLLNATSRPWAPWYAIPADSKSYMRATVADVIVRSLQTLDLAYPRLPAKELRRFASVSRQLKSDR